MSNTLLWVGVGALVLLATVLYFLMPSKKTTVKKSQYEYKKKVLVTGHELKFYKELKNIADKMKLTLFTKVNLADIIEPKIQGNQSARNKIDKKHVDFLLCDSTQLTPLLVIELDDSTHSRTKNESNDNVKNDALKSAGLPILRTYSASNLEAEINKYISPKTAVKKA